MKCHSQCGVSKAYPDCHALEQIGPLMEMYQYCSMFHSNDVACTFGHAIRGEKAPLVAAAACVGAHVWTCSRVSGAGASEVEHLVAVRVCLPVKVIISYCRSPPKMQEGAASASSAVAVWHSAGHLRGANGPNRSYVQDVDEAIDATVGAWFKARHADATSALRTW